MREALSYGVIAVAVWLGWEVVKAPLVERFPPALALRLAPSSPEVLRKAAEGELAAGEVEDAAALADASLARAPFNARALRVRGLAAGQAGQPAVADQALTLAGNWSLRDDPTHAWLVDYRLRRGDFGSAFAHADTLVRRREDLYPSVFNLFTVASSDPRALGAVVRLLAIRPPWRQDYLDWLYAREDGDPLLLALVLGLEKTAQPFNNEELRQLYQTWSAEGRLEAIRLVRTRINRPPATPAVVNGDFSDAAENQSLPFGWRLGTGVGVAAEFAQDELDPENRALRVEHDGRRSTLLVEQMLMLAPGRYVLRGRERLEDGTEKSVLHWRTICVTTGQKLGSHGPVSRTAETSGWQRFTFEFSVPDTGCPAQVIWLQPDPDDRGTTAIAWFDDIAVAPGSASAAIPEASHQGR